MRYKIHPEVLTRAAQRRLIVKIGRGVYTRKNLPMNINIRFC